MTAVIEGAPEAPETPKGFNALPVILALVGGLFVILIVGLALTAGSGSGSSGVHADPGPGGDTDPVALSAWWEVNGPTQKLVASNDVTIGEAATAGNQVMTVRLCTAAIPDAEALVRAADKLPHGDVRVHIANAANLTLSSLHHCANGEIKAATADLNRSSDEWTSATAEINALMP